MKDNEAIERRLKTLQLTLDNLKKMRNSDSYDESCMEKIVAAEISTLIWVLTN